MTSGIYPRTEKMKKNQSKIMKLRWQNPNWRNKFSLINTGHKVSKITRRKISTAHKELWKNPKFQEKISKIRKGKNIGEENSKWKGNKAKKRAIHFWVRTHKPKPQYNLCEFCLDKKYYDVANIKNHKYTRNFDDYKWLCRKCHSNFDFPDGRNNKLNKINRNYGSPN